MSQKFYTRTKPGFYYGLLFVVSVLITAATAAITSSVYNWDNLKVIKIHTGMVRDILKGPTRSLEMFNIKAITLRQGKTTHTSLIEKGCDELYIIKEGSGEISISNVKKKLNTGSIAVASQGDRVQITSKICNVYNAFSNFF
jgi:mannose-6-phosphate isomerase-like protein (cupin superfamily)